MEDSKISDFLIRAGFSPKHYGYKYLRLAICEFARHNYDARYLGETLYRDISTKENGKSHKAIEKNITCAIERAYLRGDMDFLSEMGLVTSNLRGRPTNSEFIAKSAYMLTLEKWA